MGIERFMGKYPTLSPLGPTLPYPRHGDSSGPWRQFWPPTGIRRFVGREDTQSPLPPYAWRQFMPMETVHCPVTGMKRFVGKCPTLSPLPLNHGDSFTGRSTVIHGIPYTFRCNRIPSNILQQRQFHGKKNIHPCDSIHFHMQSNSIEHSSIETVSRESNVLSANSSSSSSFPLSFISLPRECKHFPSSFFLSRLLSLLFSLLRARDIEFHRINHFSRKFIRAFVQPINYSFSTMTHLALSSFH